MLFRSVLFFIFFFNDTATTEIYTLSLHDALPIFQVTSELLDWYLPVPLQFENFQLLATTVKGEGLSKSLLNGSALQVGFRHGGEQCRMPGDHGKKPLKTLFQDLSIPAWMRDRIPLVFFNDELVAVSSFWCNPHYLPGPDEEGYVISIDFTYPLPGTPTATLEHQ